MAIGIALALLLAASPALAQSGAGDVIFQKGDVRMSNVEIMKEGCDEVRFKLAGSVQSVPSTEVIDVRYGNSPSSFNRARTHLRTGEFAKGLEEIGKVLDSISDVSPEWLRPHALYVKGEILLGLARGGDSGRYGQAAETLEAFLGAKEHRRHRLEPYVLRSLGEALAGAGETTEAENAYKRLAETDCPGPWSVYGLYGQALMLYQAGKYGDARTLLQNVIQKGGLQSGAEGLVGRARLLLGRSWLAESSFDNAAKEFKEVVREASARFSESPEFGEILAGAYNGTADAYRLKAEKFGNQEDFKEAAVAYLRVVVLCQYPPSERRHALLHGGRCAEKVGWPGVKTSLWGELKTDFPSSKEAKEAGN